ncbi:MAG: hypothetical protein CL779_03525 [Chloroflexi bacterium]|nr:hypothetical protein [Chloroflexota bacterium]|tara:strand:- start:1661 stop:1933 length:273 start_codon:yes stop_codon:yes gene_type:complete
MRVYQRRSELIADINFLKQTLKDDSKREGYINELFEHWKKTSPDSPWYDKESHRRVIEKNAVNTLIRISEDGVSNEWCGEHIVFCDLTKR